ncbi:hypothetical protein R1flu_011509 [Riccia fluitans]|uniref:J domain-containing protein n=1 Tax=Riccia fluitans TaxID=41844 RepID=A0ABD1ZC84_9MARC
MASALAIGFGSPVVRLSSSDAHSSSYGFESQFHSACTLRSSRSSAGFHRVSIECPRVASSRGGSCLCQAFAGIGTYGPETEEREEVRSSNTRGIRIGGEPTLYDILGVTENAGVKEIKSAFWQLARRFHPDVNAEEQRDECTKDFMKIHAAYTTLSDLRTKAAYDLQLSMQRYQRNGYAGGRFAPLSQEWDLSPATSERTTPAQSWSSPSPAGYSPTTSFSSRTSYCTPSSFNTQWKGRTWETDQCW